MTNYHVLQCNNNSSIESILQSELIDFMAMSLKRRDGEPLEIL